MSIKEKMDGLFMDILNEDTTYYNVGDGVKFTPEDVAQYNVGKEIGFDYGKIISLKGMDYVVELDSGVKITVKNQNAYAFGNADGDANP